MQIPAFGLERFFAAHEFSTRHLLCASDCESMSIDELLAMEPGAARRFGRLRLGYTESAGAPSLRQAICRLYQTVAPEDVLVMAGAEEAIFLFMHAVLSPGDRLLFHQPCYQSLCEIARSIGADVIPWQAREERGWALDPDDLPRLAGRGARALVLNVPHNPTGWLMDRDAFLRAAAWADRQGVVLFSDEVYRGLEPSEERRLPAAVDVSASAVSLGVLSKTYGLPGLRIGWVATHHAALRQRMAGLKDYTTICSSGPSEFLAEVGLAHAPSLAARNRALIDANLALLDAFFSRHADVLSWHRPGAGPIGFPRVLRGDVEALCRVARETEGVLLAPGALFGDEGSHVRIGFGRAGFPQGLEALERVLQRHAAG